MANMIEYRVTYTIMAVNEAHALGHIGVPLSQHISKVRGPLKKWEITYKGNSISYTYRSKAAAIKGLGNIKAERWNHDPKDYQIREI